ncbi:MAG: sodium:proton antiporter, partial [Bacteroidota bacterium]
VGALSKKPEREPVIQYMELTVKKLRPVSLAAKSPTYVNFLSASLAKFDLSVSNIADVKAFAAGTSEAGVITQSYLKAISVAAVFFGALTYIGNGPNFMVKAIAEERGVQMPSFFGYIIKYSLVILVPVLFLTWLIFFVLLG